MTDSAAPDRIFLTVESGPSAGTTATLTGLQAVIGRDLTCQLCLEDDSTVSRQHASLSWESGRWVLRDLGSKNGTFAVEGGVTQALAGPRALSVGDVFVLGSAKVSLSRAASTEARQALQLVVSVGQDVIQYELKSDSAVVPTVQIPYRAEEIAKIQRAQQALVAMEQAGAGATESAFLDAGKRLAGLLLPDSIVESLRRLEGAPLTLFLPPQLVGIAWEALCVGDEALCMSRPMARRLLLDAPLRPRRKTAQRFLIVSNPTGDLPEAHREGESLLELMAGDFGLPDVTFLAGRRATVGSVCESLSMADAAIYLGHAEHDAAQPRRGGWRLADGMLDVDRMAGLASVPSLVIAAACESARETPKSEGFSLLPEGTGLAAAFMLAGVEQYVGTLWRVPVVSGTAFGTVLLRALLSGEALGDAMLSARQHLHSVFRAPAYVCAGHVHYGAVDWRLRG